MAQDGEEDPAPEPTKWDEEPRVPNHAPHRRMGVPRRRLGVAGLSGTVESAIADGMHASSVLPLCACRFGCGGDVERAVGPCRDICRSRRESREDGLENKSSAQDGKAE